MSSRATDRCVLEHCWSHCGPKCRSLAPGGDPTGCNRPRRSLGCFRPRYRRISCPKWSRPRRSASAGWKRPASSRRRIRRPRSGLIFCPTPSPWPTAALSPCTSASTPSARTATARASAGSSRRARPMRCGDRRSTWLARGALTHRCRRRPPYATRPALAHPARRATRAQGARARGRAAPGQVRLPRPLPTDSSQGPLADRTTPAQAPPPRRRPPAARSATSCTRRRRCGGGSRRRCARRWRRSSDGSGRRPSCPPPPSPWRGRSSSAASTPSSPSCA